MLAHSQCITMYSGYAQLDMREYRMYNMYSRNFAGPIFDRIVKKHYEENDSLGDAVNVRHSCAENDSFLVPHEEVPGSNPGQGK